MLKWCKSFRIKAQRRRKWISFKFALSEIKRFRSECYTTSEVIKKVQCWSSLLLEMIKRPRQIHASQITFIAHFLTLENKIFLLDCLQIGTRFLFIALDMFFRRTD